MHYTSDISEIHHIGFMHQHRNITSVRACVCLCACVCVYVCVCTCVRVFGHMYVHVCEGGGLCMFVCVCACVCVCVCAVPTFTTLTFPCSAALCSGVKPVRWSSTSAGAPSSSSRRAMTVCPRCTASITGETHPDIWREKGNLRLKNYLSPEVGRCHTQR